MAGKITVEDLATGGIHVLPLTDQVIAAIETQRITNTIYNNTTNTQVPLYPNWREYLANNSVRSVIVPCAQTAAAALLTNAVPKTIVVTPPTFTGVTHGVALTAGVVTAAGGMDGAIFTFTGAGLPSGVTVNSSTGVISGTPAAAGSFDYTITVVDQNGNTTVAAGNITAA